MTYKQGKLSDKEFFEKLGDYVVAYSALEFLAVKVISELKKSLDKISGGHAHGTTPMGSSMPGVGFGMNTPGSHVTAATLPGAGRPPSIISAGTALSTPGVLPTPDPALLPKHSPSGGPTCSSCGSLVKVNAKFCAKCGNKIQ